MIRWAILAISDETGNEFIAAEKAKMLKIAVAVVTLVARRPPHRSVGAGLPHTTPAPATLAPKSAGDFPERLRLYWLRRSKTIIIAKAPRKLEIGRIRGMNRHLAHLKSGPPHSMKLLASKGVTRWHKPKKFTALHGTQPLTYVRGFDKIGILIEKALVVI